jgi:hypothetical protein
MDPYRCAATRSVPPRCETAVIRKRPGFDVGKPLDIGERCLTLAVVLIAAGLVNGQEEHCSSNGPRPAGSIPTQRLAAGKL